MPLSSYNAGARKALAAMKKQYGAKRGASIFYAHANRVGKGKTRLQKVNSTYRKRTTKKKRKT